MKAKLKVEGPKTLHKAIEVGQIYEDMSNNNINLINQTEFVTPPGYSLIETPSSNGKQVKSVRMMQNTLDGYLAPKNTPRQRTRTLTLSSIDTIKKEHNERILKLNNVTVKYIPDTSASITVISEDEAKAIGAEIKPYDQNKIKVVTADGKEVKDLLGFAEVDIILGDQKLERVKTLVFKNATNPCLIGRDVLATHPDIKQHFEAIIGRHKPLKKQEVPKQSDCKTRHCDRSSDDDYDEMDDKYNDNLAVKGCWAKNKSKIDGESIQTKVQVNVDRAICKTKINNSMEKRTSTIENVYNCSNDHECESNRNEINSKQHPESEDEPNILICAIDLIIEDQEMINSSLITSDESMVISPNNTTNKSRQNKRNNRKLGLSEYITPAWKKFEEDSSIMTSDRSHRTDITSPDNPSESSDWVIEEQYQTIWETTTTRTRIVQTSTPNRPSGPLLEENSERTLNSTNT